jgi:hypothetical protein
VSAQVAADLRAAAEVLRRDGWTQGVFHRRADEGRICHCAEGAIQVTVGRHINIRPDEHCDAGADWDMDYSAPADRRYDAAEAALSAHVGASQCGGIPAWNDDENRTADEVIAALEAAADAAEAQA